MKTSQRSDWKSLVYLIGGAIGIVVGLLSAHLYTRAVEENNDGEQPQLGTGDVFALGMATLALVRHVTDLGARGNNRR